MEAGLKLPEGSLVTTMTAYNQAAASGEDPEFHKYRDWLKPLNEGPYAAFDCSLANAVFTGFTLGGLRTDINAQVLTATGGYSRGLIRRRGLRIQYCPGRSRLFQWNLYRRVHFLWP